MWRLLASVRRNLQGRKKSSRVADENMFEAGNAVAELQMFEAGDERRTRHHAWSGFSLVCSVLQAPMSIFSCVSNPHAGRSDGAWASGELAQVSEMNHLMVNYSMRYAILM